VQSPASAAAASEADAGIVEDGPCATDADCAFTKFAPGACCPMLCEPRIVTKKRAQALEDGIPGCGGKADSCPQPLCRPPRQSIAPACEQGRCVAHISPSN
jgi:hypothetical protein